MRDRRGIAGRIVASVVLTLAVSLPAWGAVAPSQNLTLRVPHVPGAWLAPTPGEMVRGSRQRARLVIRATPASTRADEQRSGARTSTPVPPPAAHRALPRSPGAVVTQDDGSARRRLGPVHIAFASARPGRVAHRRVREVAHPRAGDAGDAIFHEAHAPPPSSSFV